jgi:general secretion pathway protein M
MRNWFDSLEERERNFVMAGAVVVLLALLYVLGWAPLDNKHNSLKAEVANWQQSLVDLRPIRAATSDGSSGQSVVVRGSQQTPIIIVDQTLRSRGLDRYRRRSQPTAGDGIRVEFENVAFDELVLWLGDLSEHYAMDVQAGSFSTGSQDSPGRVNATLTLERGL